MTLLSAADLVYLRTEAEKLLPDTCDIVERQLASDGQGGFTEAWAPSYQDVPCRLAESSGREKAVGNREAGDSSWVLTLAHDQAIGRDDRVYIGGRTYEVVFVNEGRSHDTVRRVQLRWLS